MSAVQKVSSESLMKVHRQESRKPARLCERLGAAAADYPENMLSVQLGTWEMFPGTAGSSDVSAENVTVTVSSSTGDIQYDLHTG